MNARTNRHHPPAELIDALRRTHSMVCCGHVSPDADCLGAALALARAWSAYTNRDAAVWVTERCIPARLRFMLDLANVRRAVDADFEAADRIVIVDTSQPSRADQPKQHAANWNDNQRIFNIDHHFTNTCFGQIDWIVENASSTCELVYELLHGLQCDIDPSTAALLYSGIYTDTGGFSLPNTTANALHIAAELTQLGVSPSDIAERVDRSVGQPQFELLKHIYQNTRTLADGAIAFSTVSHDELVRSGCDPSDIDDQVNVPRSMAGVAIAALFTEVEPGRVRINLRGESSTEVAGLAQRFGGGGHRQAAGVIYSGSLDEAVDRIINAAIEMLDQTEPTTGADEQPQAIESNRS
ncbi:MAG: bifunctional oligoribonuclease/PAP phosphatase NrnA [Phycisphaerae bacterium]|nr:bifunctional oligoribonuclease/PAP phosphatase NrnA [Phycisphaerales bacterium]